MAVFWPRLLAGTALTGKYRARDRWRYLSQSYRSAASASGPVCVIEEVAEIGADGACSTSAVQPAMEYP